MVQLDLVGSLRDLNVLSVGVRLLLAMVLEEPLDLSEGFASGQLACGPICCCV